ncbi:Membrane protein involved in the export of O-antigen and teichoic acid [Hyella patelloides LEGE 07179]|uniref:Membrane protein involved in the export of O-antigen and teichoic acid n=1 Tax=Hyella patelloides LEGE 07179 TaxID=945734 RepID=A0A563VX95_9CYAN|nr:flippase [Hyella patelloides]VEP16059.1 Membrane protein involved in the export of O-antigen and teichoic acid [Hyella patelloides LEGE 07179]
MINRSVRCIQDLWQTLFAKEQQSSLKKRLVKGAAGTLGLRIAATGLNFLTSILLARLLGASGFGVYTYAFTWTQLLSLGATLGLDKLIVREVAVYKTKSSWNLMRGLLNWANQIALITSVVLILVAIGVAWSLNVGANSEQFLAFCLAMLIIPIDTLRNLRLAAMRGLNKIVMGLVPELLIAPALLIVLVGCGYLFLGEDLNAPWVILIRLVITLITLAIGMKLLYRILPDEVKKATAKYQAKTWLNSALPFMFMGSMYLIKSRTDILMLGAIQGAEVVGIYFAVSRGAQLIDFVTNAANTVLAPNIASLYAEGKTEKIQRILTKSSRTVLLTSLPIIIGLMVFGYWYLSLFGSEFTQGQNALIVLCVGQLVNVATGSAGLLLSMTGHERYTLISRCGSTLLNVVLNALLIPRWGLSGAAIATVGSTVLLNVENTIVVRKKLGIHCTVFGKLL